MPELDSITLTEVKGRLAHLEAEQIAAILEFVADVGSFEAARRAIDALEDSRKAA